MIQKMNRKKGFTLIELMVVVVIIGILATIGFVSFSSAQNKAKKSKAQSTVSQVKSKLGEYYVDNENYPDDKDAVVTYLNANGGTSTATEFNGSTNYTYAASPSGCDNSTTDCTGYTLTAAKAYWNGGASDSDITVTP